MKQRDEWLVRHPRSERKRLRTVFGIFSGVSGLSIPRGLQDAVHIADLRIAETGRGDGVNTTTGRSGSSDSRSSALLGVRRPIHDAAVRAVPQAYTGVFCAWYRVMHSLQARTPRPPSADGCRRRSPSPKPRTLWCDRNSEPNGVNMLTYAKGRL